MARTAKRPSEHGHVWRGTSRRHSVATATQRFAALRVLKGRKFTDTGFDGAVDRRPPLPAVKGKGTRKGKKQMRVAINESPKANVPEDALFSFQRDPTKHGKGGSNRQKSITLETTGTSP